MNRCHLPPVPWQLAFGYPAATMHLACRRCDRHGQYHVARLIAAHGRDVTLPDLRNLLAVGCPLVGHRSTPCDIYFVDLVEPDA